MPETDVEYTIRKYRSGDETLLAELFNSEYAALAGFVPRTVEYWRWCCLGRPDVDKEGIMIMEYANRIVGYAVVGRSGNVWELCSDSHYDAKMIVTKLLARALDYAQSVGSSSVVLNVSTKEPLLRRACQEMDFVECPPEPMFTSILDLPQLICAIIQSKNFGSDMNEVFWFWLKGCPSWCISSFGVKLDRNLVTVLTDPPPMSRITIETEMSTLVALIFGTESVSKALLSLKVHFHPFLRISKARKLLNLLQTKTPWFVPRADRTD